ncbi:MAG TPA: oxalate/formate MFS antiporter [Steroidobacteraceae bacterium]|jgi:OFA family oxalate/formate antiporter-like MFS transporter|nr:oxalate/formate MFS antiporter [Steroidobacteraceae bacterium]
MNAPSNQAIKSQASTSPLANPWVQLIIGVICMVMIANLQYGWTLFVGPIDAKYHWGRASIQVAFTIFVVLETWLVPVEGYLVDRFGPRWITVIGGALCGIAWTINSMADSLPMLYFAAALGGIGAGGVYGTCIGNALRWFPNRRGLAAGLTAAGFGAGSALTIIPIANMIKASGYQHTFLTFGVFQGIVVFVLGFLLLVPPVSLMVAPPKLSPGASRFQAKPIEMVKTPIFWVMYAMFVMMATGGLMAVAQLAPIAKDFKIADVPVSLVGLTLPALTFALTIDRILNGLCRPFFGWLSDHIGRENTMFLAFTLEGVGIIALANLGTNPVLFVILSGVVFFGWGEIYSLFPATVSDTFGTTFATANAGLLYTAKGTAALLVPYANVLSAKTGSWHLVFMLAAALNLIAAVMAILVLKPMRGSYTSRSMAASPAPKPA